ncbi:SMEK domain-containing protein [Bradyrhizobium pachyrhizi]|uniref:SMEK domain-containing protein n=1 Tax=Bradyrhizobium pachyrhizi TaxID=280333 RepID=UPI0024B161ED|nr:SMEK domain-containing protein [Bradyrhizobium pachyrhizi]WFU52366.1 SMEK domain-containing protein [Bradyrhizobium pachyrhizi]
MRQLEVENQLRDVVGRIILQVELATSQGRTDINLALEDAFIPILKSVYNLPHLINLNRKQKNFPGIDLGDDHDRVAFQITSTTTLEKVKFTVRQFMDRAYYNTFDELFILMLGQKQSSYSQASVNEHLTSKFAFNCKKHIIDLGDLLGQVSGLRLAAQERVLSEFRHILGEVDAYISYSSESLAAPTAITSNLQQIRLPKTVYVGELTIDDKKVIAQAKTKLGYKGKARSRRSVVKMALLLNGVESDAWVCHDNKLFSFQDIEQCGLISVVDAGSVEPLGIADLAKSTELDNVNILKQLLSAETREQLKQHHVRMHTMDGFFFFGPTAEAQLERKETWVGKKTAIRRVYEVKYQKKDPTKIAHHRHLSFELTFTKLDDTWYAQIVPSWYYSYDGYRRSHWHDDLLSQQKRLEHNLTVRNMVRFVAYFLSETNKNEDEDCGLRFLSLVEFNVRETDEAEPVDDDGEDVTDMAEGTAA